MKNKRIFAKDLTKEDIIYIDSEYKKLTDLFIFRDCVYISSFPIILSKKFLPYDTVEILDTCMYLDTDDINNLNTLRRGGCHSAKQKLNNKYRKKESKMKVDIEKFKNTTDGAYYTFENLEALATFEDVIVIFLGIQENTLIFKAVAYVGNTAITKRIIVNYDSKISPSWILKSLKGSDEF